MMGSPPGEPGRDEVQETAHPVTLTRAFEMMTTEVTQQLYFAITHVNPASNVDCGWDCPVEDLLWWVALRFANAMSDRARLPHCYTVDVNLDAEVFTVVWAGPDCTGYRLPTEAEWEYATRAGANTAFSSGPLELGGGNCADDRNGNLDRVGWYCNNAEQDATGPVARLEPNGWGLYDLHGNAQEWVWDGFRPHTAAAATDPTGSLTVTCDSAGDCDRVIRGGHFQADADECRAASRRPKPS